MEDTDACFKPKGPSAAHAESAVFVHALGIEPSINLLTQRVPSAAASKKLSVEIDVDGEILCYILDLSGRMDVPWGSVKPVQEVVEQGYVQTPFATIRWKRAFSGGHGSFSLRDEAPTNAERMRFGAVGRLMKDGSRIKEKYYNAVYQQHGTSDQYLSWPEPDACLKDRIPGTGVEYHKVTGKSQPDSPKLRGEVVLGTLRDGGEVSGANEDIGSIYV